MEDMLASVRNILNSENRKDWALAPLLNPAATYRRQPPKGLSPVPSRNFRRNRQWTIQQLRAPPRSRRPSVKPRRPQTQHSSASPSGTGATRPSPARKRAGPAPAPRSAAIVPPPATSFPGLRSRRRQPRSGLRVLRADGAKSRMERPRETPKGSGYGPRRDPRKDLRRGPRRKSAKARAKAPRERKGRFADALAKALENIPRSAPLGARPDRGNPTWQGGSRTIIRTRPAAAATGRRAGARRHHQAVRPRGRLLHRNA